MEDYKLDLTMDIDEEVLNEVIEYLDSDRCNLVTEILEAGVSFPAMLFMINSIFTEEKRHRQKIRESKNEQS